LERVEDRVLAMECDTEDGRFWVLKSLEGGMTSPNRDATDARKHNLAIVP
jgi:hypothetical protein